jgi:CRP/FNR family transcriptional regulator
MSGHGELLAESAAANASTFKLAITQDDIATRLGTVRELVSRSLGRLRAAGVVEVAGCRVTIRDARRLSAIVDGQTLVARVVAR